MKLGLVRHYKVVQTLDKTLLSPEKFDEAIKEYDSCPVTPSNLIIDSADWDICYCSSLPRAVTTANNIYNKEIIRTDLIVEVPISSFTKRNVKLPVLAWHIGAKIAWYKSHSSQIEDIHATKKRIEDFYSIISNSGYQNILIVAHGYFLKEFHRIMQRKKFKGNVDWNMRNGKLYIIEK